MPKKGSQPGAFDTGTLFKKGGRKGSGPSGEPNQDVTKKSSRSRNPLPGGKGNVKSRDRD